MSKRNRIHHFCDKPGNFVYSLVIGRYNENECLDGICYSGHYMVVPAESKCCICSDRAGGGFWNCDDDSYWFYCSRGIDVYQIENLLLAFAGLIQAAVLYFDFLGFYLLNGWIPLNKIWIFTLIFVIIFVAIWFSIYIPIRIKISKMNKMIHQ